MGGTFHATSNLLLRRHGHHLGFAPGFTIIDRGDAEGIVNLIKSSLGMAGAGKRFPSKRMIVNILSGAVNKSRPIEDLVYRAAPAPGRVFRRSTPDPGALRAGSRAITA